jgi:hypothetical protein
VATVSESSALTTALFVAFCLGMIAARTLPPGPLSAVSRVDWVLFAALAGTYSLLLWVAPTVVLR